MIVLRRMHYLTLTSGVKIVSNGALMLPENLFGLDCPRNSVPDKENNHSKLINNFF